MKHITPKELLDWGLIFEINRSVLHPFGLALSVELDKDENVLFSNEIWDFRDDPEGVIFEEKTYLAGHKKFQDFLDDQGMDILEKRLATLGYMEQTEMDLEE